MFCGTVSDPEDYKKAAFFGNNQLLVDNLIKEGFAIDKNYLDRLEDIQEISATRESMITSQIPLFHIPVKAWIYREDVDTGNITLAQLDQVIDRLNELFSGQSNIRFFLLCDIDEIIISISFWENWNEV